VAQAWWGENDGFIRSPLLLVGFEICKIGKIGAYIFHRRLFSATNKTATLSLRLRITTRKRIQRSRTGSTLAPLWFSSSTFNTI
jgi:hypothetical protein